MNVKMEEQSAMNNDQLHVDKMPVEHLQGKDQSLVRLNMAGIVQKKDDSSIN